MGGCLVRRKDKRETSRTLREGKLAAWPSCETPLMLLGRRSEASSVTAGQGCRRDALPFVSSRRRVTPRSSRTRLPIRHAQGIAGIESCCWSTQDRRVTVSGSMTTSSRRAANHAHGCGRVAGDFCFARGRIHDRTFPMIVSEMLRRPRFAFRDDPWARGALGDLPQGVDALSRQSRNGELGAGVVITATVARGILQCLGPRAYVVKLLRQAGVSVSGANRLGHSRLVRADR